MHRLKTCILLKILSPDRLKRFHRKHKDFHVLFLWFMTKISILKSMPLAYSLRVPLPWLRSGFSVGIQLLALSFAFDCALICRVEVLQRRFLILTSLHSNRNEDVKGFKWGSEAGIGSWIGLAPLHTYMAFNLERDVTAWDLL